MSALDVIVAVPGSVVELHEAHAIFDELAGEQALATEGVGRVLADSVKLLGFFIFLGQIGAVGGKLAWQVGAAGSEGIQSALADIHAEHIGAGPQQPPRRSAADATGSAGNDIGSDFGH